MKPTELLAALRMSEVWLRFSGRISSGENRETIPFFFLTKLCRFVDVLFFFFIGKPHFVDDLWSKRLEFF